MNRWIPFGTAILLSLFCFGWLAEAVWNRNGLAADIPILNFVHQFATPMRDKILVAITNTARWRTVVILTAASAFYLFMRKRVGDACYLIGCVTGSGLTDITMKHLFQRIRPHLWPSPAPEHNFSFPSGHATGSMALILALAVVIWPTGKRWLIPGFIYVAAVGLSRVYLGVHFPSDVLGAWALAVTWVCALLLLRLLMETQSAKTKKPALILVGIFLSLLAAVTGYGSSNLSHHNFRIIVPGEAARSGQMSAYTLDAYICNYGFKSIVNLRGENRGAAWYIDELAVTKNRNISHFDFGISATERVSEEKMARLNEILSEAPKPVLIHCDGGADRSALASALYLYTIAGNTPAQAAHELSVWNGHWPWLRPKVGAMDDSFRDYVKNHSLDAIKQ